MINIEGDILNNYTLTNWDVGVLKTGLLLFAEAAEEMLFHHSHDSFKVPTLNFKFLCYDLVTTIQEIEKEKLDSGNLYPLIDELIVSYKKIQYTLLPEISRFYQSEDNRKAFEEWKNGNAEAAKVS